MAKRDDNAPKFDRESDLCTAFIEAARREQRTYKRDLKTWEFYPETEGWDILAVRHDGVQVGIEAKLRLNNTVVAQAIPDRWSYGILGPDFRAVLVPQSSCDNGLDSICGALGVTIIRLGRRESYGGISERFVFYPSLPSEMGDDFNWHEWAPEKRHRLPEYVPDVVAGASAPIQLTRWKIKAIKIAIILEERPISRADFKEVGIDPGRWMEPQIGWLTRTDSGYIAGDRMPNFKAQHPLNYEQIKADRAKWDWVKSLPIEVA